MHIFKTLEEVEIAAAMHSRRRVVVLRRDDGWYSYAEQYHFVSEYEGSVIAEGWHTLSSNGVVASVEIAEAEGRAAFARQHGLTA